MTDPVDKALKDMRDDEDKPTEVDLHEDRTREIRAKAFARMRTDWNGPDGVAVAAVVGQADMLILQTFASAYSVMNDLWDIVREPEVNEQTGEMLKDAHGFVIWKRGPGGNYIEDFSRLGKNQKDHLLHRITTNIFGWEQDAANIWGESMFSKAMFEERFADQFGHAPGSRPTVDDRTQFARRESADERYFAIYKSLVSRKADALVASLKLISQRLKDTLG